MISHVCLGLGLAWTQSTRRIQFHICLVFQVVLMNEARIGKLDQSDWEVPFWGILPETKWMNLVS
jgi:hypothetical protein